MGIRRYYNILLKRLWLIILLPMLFGTLTTYISFRTYTPMYKSNTVLLVFSNNPDPRMPITYYDVLAGQQLIKEYKEILLSRAVKDKVVDELKKYKIRPSEVDKSVSVSLKPETRILVITVTNKSAEMAQLIADEISEIFIKRVTELTYTENIAIVDRAEKAKFPIPAEHKRNIMIAFVAAFIIAVALIFFIEDLDETIKTAEDVEDDLGLKILGFIPKLDIK